MPPQSDYPRYWPTVGDERTFLANTNSPILVSRAPPKLTQSSHAAEAAGTVGARSEYDSEDIETETADYVTLVEEAWKDEKNENISVMISRKRTREYEKDQEQRLHRHTRASPKRMTGWYEAGEGSKDLKEHQMGEGRKTNSGRVQEANEERYQTWRTQKAATQAKFKEGCGNAQQAKAKEEPAMENCETDDDVLVDEDYTTEVENYQWRGDEDKLEVEQEQKSQHYFLSHLHVWVV